jgi:hypothetical protein
MMEYLRHWRWVASADAPAAGVLIFPLTLESPMLAITTTSEGTGRWIKMRRSLAPFSKPEPLAHAQSLADFITTTSTLRFSVHTGLSVRRAFFPRRPQGRPADDDEVAPVLLVPQQIGN